MTKFAHHSDPRLIMPPERETHFPPFVQFHNRFSAPECDAIRQLAEHLNLEDGAIGNANNNDSHVEDTYRKVKTAGLLPDYEICGANIHWLFERVRDDVVWANNNFYGFDLHGLWQQINFLRYDAPQMPGDIPGHYNAHQDFGGGKSSQRKLSVVIQLSRPEEYDGCRLLLHTEKEFDPGVVGQGSMIVFPSWTVHRVTDITRGRRDALVSWVSGPPFR